MIIIAGNVSGWRLLKSMNEFDEIVLRERERKLSISRVPKRIKEEFIAFADEEFCEDYGATLHYVWDNFKLWKIFFENVDMKLDSIINLIQNQNKPEKETEGISLLSGKKIKRGEK